MNFSSFFESESKKSILNNAELIMFFIKDDIPYGCKEEDRLSFARMRNPDKSISPEELKFSTFTALNLKDLINGKETLNLFGLKDFPKINIVDQEKILCVL